MKIVYTLGVNSMGDWIIRKNGEFHALYKRASYDAVWILNVLRALNRGAQ